MNRHLGIESMLGIGGGLVSDESRQCLDKAEVFCRKKKFDKAMPHFLKAIELDPNNLDAIIKMAEVLDLAQCIVILELAEKKGREMLIQVLGPDTFADDGGKVGEFWYILQTRPYMRVLNALEYSYSEAGKPIKASKICIEMLRLCPSDNMGVRFTLGTLLIQAKRYGDALSFSQQWMDSRGDRVPRGGTTFATPSESVPGINPKGDYQLRDTAIMYTAALSSYRFFGDCEQSRRYLELAAACNPHVLARILGRIARPSKPNTDLRSPNGPEDAHDYLWRSQNLWEMQDIWTWADTKVPAAKNGVLKTCSNPTCETKEKRVVEFKRCSACHKVSYCSSECQKEDWQRHKPACLAHKRGKDLNKGRKTKPSDGMLKFDVMRI